MTAMRTALLSLIRDCSARKFIVAVCVCFALGSAGSLRAETFPITGTAGFETGLWEIAVEDTDHVDVDWGDGTPAVEGLAKCVGIRIAGLCTSANIYGTHRYELPGLYTITITTKTQTETTSATILPPGDFVILSIGDSVASGEGNPRVLWDNTNFPPRSYWDDAGSGYDPDDIYVDDLIYPDEKTEYQKNDCHRSRLAGPALAELQVQASNPAITVVHFACSGSTVYTPNATKHSSTTVGQLRIARRHLPRIDILLISAGANDMNFTESDSSGEGFGDVLTRCLTPLNNCSDDPVFVQQIDASIAGIHADYLKLDSEIHCIDPDTNLREPDCTDQQIPKLVLLTEYMDETHVKRVSSPSTDGFPDFLCIDGGIRQNEWMFLYNHVVVGLNDQVHESPWNSVWGIQDDFMPFGYCSGDSRWIVTAPDSLSAQNDVSGTGHPNKSGHSISYQNRIYQAMVALNPPVTTASATAGGTPYTFGTWTSQDVEVDLAAINFITEAGIQQTLYAVDNPDCFFGTGKPAACSTYGGPFTIASSGRHSVTLFSLNLSGNPEAPQAVQVWIDKSPPVSAGPGTQKVRRGQSTTYQVAIGHAGWDDSNVSLSCTTDAPLAVCIMEPALVSLDGDGLLSAAEVATGDNTGLGLAPPAPSKPVSPLGALRLLLALATAAFVAAMFLARCRQWGQAISFAALALLFGGLCVGCGSPDNLGTPRGTYTVTITGTSGLTSHTVQTKLIVQ
jgi:hypothetical protein